MRTYSDSELSEIIEQNAEIIAQKSSEILIESFKKASFSDEGRMHALASTIFQVGDMIQELYPDMAFSSITRLSNIIVKEAMEMSSANEQD